MNFQNQMFPMNYPIPLNNQASWIRDQSDARRGDIIPQHLLGNQSGFTLGIKMGVSGNFGRPYPVSVVIPARSQGIMCFLGGSGTGKSTCFVNPSLDSWEDAMLVVDINGTSAEFYEALKKPKRPHKTLSMVEGLNTDFRYEPFSIIRKTSPTSYKAIRKLALEIIPLLPNEDGKTKYFIDTARNVLTGALANYFDLGTTFIDALVAINDTPFELLASNIKTELKDKYMSQVAYIKNMSENDMVSSVISVLKQHLIPLVQDPEVFKVFSIDENTPSENIVTWEDIETYNIFIAVDENEIEEKSSAIRLLLSQAICYLRGRPSKHSPQGKLLKPCLLMLDEFPLYGRLDSIEDAIATLRKRNVAVAIFVQDLSQIDTHYSVLGRRTILSNCDYQIFLGSNDLESLNYFSERINSIIVAQRGYSENYTVDPTGIPTRSIQVSEVREPAFYPHDLADLGNEAIIIHKGSFCKVLKSPKYIKYEEEEQCSITTKVLKGSLNWSDNGS
jgi:type IV secretion system protein VirD4